MREIKFRAWDVIDKEMFRVVLLSAPQGKDYLIVSGRGGSTTTEKEQCVLMQFTGLKDKNGKECFEGDIVRRLGDDGKEYISDIVFNEEWGAFAFHSKHKKGAGQGWSRMHGGHAVFWWEVIGNIYENPDLLSNPKDNGTQ